MGEDEQFSLCWNNFNTNLSAGFHESLCREDLVDVTLAAEGQIVKAHRLVLSVCSPYFRKMFTQMPVNQHAFVFLKDVSHSALKDLIQFMYCGEVNVKQEALPAFISTAEALQIKGLTDSDPAPPSQTPPAPYTPAPQIQVQTSPRVRQRTSTIGRSYKIDTGDDSGDDSKQQTTQIVIQTTAPPHQTQATIATQPPQQQSQQQHQQHHHHQPQPSQHITQQPIQTQTHQIASVNMPTSTTAAVVTHKRPAQRISLGSVSHIKRAKSTIDPLDVAETVVPQQLNVQTTVVTTEVKPQAQQHHHQSQQHHHQSQPQQSSETEYIDLPIELPTKSEPGYVQETGEVDQGEQDGNYVEDESYGDMRYDESYFTENEDVAVAANNATTSGSANTSAAATTSKAVIKQQSLSDSYMDTSADQGNSDAQELEYTYSSRGNPLVLLNGYVFRKHYGKYWCCQQDSKYKCRARIIIEGGKIKKSIKCHNHSPESGYDERRRKLKNKNNNFQIKSIDSVGNTSSSEGDAEEEDEEDEEDKQQSDQSEHMEVECDIGSIIQYDGNEDENHTTQKDSKIEYIYSQRGHPLIALNNYLFRRNGVNSWRCIGSVKHKCKARLLVVDGKIRNSNEQHTHRAQPERVACGKAFNEPLANKSRSSQKRSIKQDNNGQETWDHVTPHFLMENVQVKTEIIDEEENFIISN